MKMEIESSTGRNEIVDKVLSMQPMPAGCVTVELLLEEGKPDTITGIHEVLFLAVCEVHRHQAPLQCYGIQSSSDNALIWRFTEDVDVYFYGSYLRKCELLKVSPARFTDWYHQRKKSFTEFNVELPSH